MIFSINHFFKILHERKLSGDVTTVQAIVSVLAAAQKYMRDQLVSWQECLHKVNVSRNDVDVDIMKPRLVEPSVIHRRYENL